MSIRFHYTVKSVDEAARCMEIVYSADGYETMNIGARLPFEGEALEDVIRSFAPIYQWEQSKLPVVVPQVGLNGIVEPVVEHLGPIEAIGTETF